MRRAEESFAKRLDFARVFLDLRSKHVSEHVAADRSRVVKIIMKLVLQPTPLGVPHEVRLDAKIISEVDIDLAAAAEDIKACNRRKIGMHVNKRKPNGHFNLGNILRRRYADSDQ